MSRASKRLFDVAGAAGGLVAFAPVMAAVALAVSLDGGPIFFRQTRLGYRRRPFTILKFRSMRDGTVTPVGRVLRATGLDELPQFLNILRGDMSAVGPRPLTDETVQRIGWHGPDCDFRWLTRPGLTGLAQIVGCRSIHAALELDRTYVTRQTLQLDCRLIGLSFAVNLFGKGRVQRFVRRFRCLPDVA
jgi:lipopolysaccharide/colanic/teichoic acid biosynthesis glycosyltransferase